MVTDSGDTLLNLAPRGSQKKDHSDDETPEIERKNIVTILGEDDYINLIMEVSI